MEIKTARPICYPIVQYEVCMSNYISKITHTIHNFTTNVAGLVTLPVIGDLRLDATYAVAVVPVNVIGTGESNNIILCELPPIHT